MKHTSLIIFALLMIGLASLWSTSEETVAAKLPDASASKKNVDGSATKTSWPSYRGNREQLGVSPATLPDELVIKWQLKTEGPVLASAVIDLGKMFIGSTDGKFYCVDITTGKQAWVFETKTGPLPSYAGKNEEKLNEAIEAPATVIGDRVVFGCTDGMLYCLDVKNGKMQWAYETDDKITGAANWIDNPNGEGKWVIVGSHDARLHCVDLATGKKQWFYETDNFINGAPAVSKGRTVFGGCDGLMHVVNVKDGKKIKEIEIADYIAASAALTDKFAYVGHHGNKFVAVDLDKGEIEWKYGKKEFPYLSAPAVTDDVIVVGGQDNRLHCINRKDGKAIWEFRTRGNIDSSPVVAGNRVVVGGEDGRVYLINLKDGTKVWEYEIGKPVMSSPAVIDGMFIIGCDDGTVYAFGAK